MRIYKSLKVSSMYENLSNVTNQNYDTQFCRRRNRDNEWHYFAFTVAGSYDACFSTERNNLLYFAAQG